MRIKLVILIFFNHLYIFSNDNSQTFKITIIGTGYIGLVTGACLANLGHNIICADIDENKINQLKKGIIPIYEPGLEEIVIKNFSENRLKFTTSIAKSIQESNIIFIAVNTPMSQDGNADISAVEKVSEEIGKNLNNFKIICIRSTVPIGTANKIHNIIYQFSNTKNFDIVSMPEFLREGSAVYDFMNPDRIIIGTSSIQTYKIFKNLFSNTNCLNENIIHTDNKSAEAIKYVSNSFLALKISFINEIANLCDLFGIDVFEVTKGIGLDKRIGNQFLKPGPGYGGSCFPKDVKALIKMANNIGMSFELMKNVTEINDLQKKVVIEKLKKLIDLQGKTIGLLGLAFKGNTDDIRYSPAINIIKFLKQENCKIKVFDPKAMNNMKLIFPELIYCENPYDLANLTDAIIVVTDWQEFIDLDLEKIGNVMRSKTILDTRNILNIEKLKKLNFMIDTIGRNVLTKK